MDDYTKYIINPLNEEAQKDKEIKEILEREARVKKIIIFLIIAIVVVYLNRNIFVKKPVEYVDDLYDLPSPTQTKSSIIVQKKVGDVYVNIESNYAYSIKGLVVNVQGYPKTDVYNKLAPIDIGLSWGFMPKENGRLKWISTGTRYLKYSTKDIDWYRSVGGASKIQLYWSNNHLIAADDTIARRIACIKKGDYLQIDGYLVNAYWDYKNGGSSYVKSSVSRSDSGNGACEVIYVTDIKWLKEK